MVSELAIGFAGLAVGGLCGYSVTKLRRPRGYAHVYELDPELEDRIGQAARTWAGGQPNPYAEQVARPWIEAFARNAMREKAEIDDEAGGR